jgi:hypothetical protein
MIIFSTLSANSETRQWTEFDFQFSLVQTIQLHRPGEHQSRSMTENEHKTVDSQPSNEHSGSAFRKSAFVAVLIAFVVYLYQVGIHSLSSKHQ